MKLLVVDGRVGRNTIHCIREFQRKVVELKAVDGRVDANGKTYRKLAEVNTKNGLSPFLLYGGLFYDDINHFGMRPAAAASTANAAKKVDPVPQPKSSTAQLTPHFKWSEFACHDEANTPVPASLRDNVKSLAKNLEVLRKAMGKPIKINSAYRTSAHNKAVGGATSSQHLKAKAADIVIAGYSPKEVHKKIEGLILRGKMLQGGLGLYNSFVHYDIRGTKARWDRSG